MQRTPDTVRSIDDCTTAFKPRCLVQSWLSRCGKSVHFIRSAFNVAELSMNQRISYPAFPTDNQNLDLQRDALRQAGCSTIYEEAASGRAAARRSRQCRKALQARGYPRGVAAGSTRAQPADLVQIVADLEQRGVQFEPDRKIETRGGGAAAIPCFRGAGRV